MIGKTTNTISISISSSSLEFNKLNEFYTKNLVSIKFYVILFKFKKLRIIFFKNNKAS